MSSTPALAAKEIKKLLSKKFPLIKFTVKSQSYTGGSAVNVSYVDGVPTGEVWALISQFKYGHYDGMNETYEYSSVRKDIPQVKYLIVQRSLSELSKQVLIKDIMAKYGLTEWNDDICKKTLDMWTDQAIWKASLERTF